MRSFLEWQEVNLSFQHELFDRILYPMPFEASAYEEKIYRDALKQHQPQAAYWLIQPNLISPLW